MTFFMSGQDIYDNFQQGAGVEGISSSAALVNQLAERHRDRVERLHQLTTRMESAWQGEAAGAAQRGLGPLVKEHELSAQALHIAQDLTGRQAGSFGVAKNDVVPVPPPPGEVPPFTFADTDAVLTYFQQVTEHNEAAQHNVDVMYGYTGASQYNTERQPTAFGELTDDQATIAVGSPDTIDSADFRESTSDSEQHGSVSWPGSGSAHGYHPPTDGGPDTPVTPGTGSSTSAGTTTPGSVTTTPLPAGPSSLSPGTDLGLGQPRPATDGGIVSGVGAGGLPADGRNGGIGRRGGLVGGSPRDGMTGRGPGGGVGAGQSATAGRAAPGVTATGPGRGGVGFGGMPVGAGGRGRGEEDTERKAPAYLEGDDPDELFDTDVLTAPPAIGDEDD